MGKALPGFALMATRLGLFLILPVSILASVGLLSFGAFLAVFAASSALGGALSAYVFRRSARGLPIRPAAELSYPA